MGSVADEALRRAMRALEDVRDQLVVVGGTAQRLFPLHPLGRDPGYALLTTQDVDIAASLELQYKTGSQLLEQLLAAGFEERVAGANESAWTYPLEGQNGAYLQFIANLKGTGTTRKGKDRLMNFSGIHAEKLRNIDILLHATWPISLESDGFQIQVNVVNPSAYLVQKLLTIGKRSTSERGKDLLYIFDTLSIFGSSLETLGSKEAELVPELSKKQRREAIKVFKQYCCEEVAATRQAATIAKEQRQSPPSAAQIALACKRNLPRVLRGLLGNVE